MMLQGQGRYASVEEFMGYVEEQGSRQGESPPSPTGVGV